MSIVFGTTLTPESQPFAEVAARLARRMDVPLRLVHVSEDERAPVVLGTDEEPILGPLRSRLSAEVERLAASTGAEVHPHLAAGSVVNALVSVAELELATALVVGSRTGSSRNLLGDTAERSARRSAIPVMTLREPERLLAWLGGQRPLRILVGADLGRAADAARAFGGAMRKLGACRIEVAFVAEPREVHAQLGLSRPVDEHVLAPEAEAALLRELSLGVPADDGEVVLRVVPARGGPDARLVTLADEGNFDLVVVGQRRQSLVEALWYGSVARGVLRAAPVSVACVPPPLVAPGPAYRPPRVVVVATDLGDAGARAVAQAEGMTVEGGTMHVVHVLPGLGPVDDARSAREQAWRALTKLGGSDPAARDVAFERHVLEGDAAEQILALAERLGADLIVLGARSRPAISRALLGSVALAVTGRSRAPVLLVPLLPR